jgi:Domain of unknown function (DUF6249)
MHTLIPPLANIVGVFELMIPISLFALTFGVIVGAMYFKNRNQKQWHETARIALEKGQPIPIARYDLEEKMGHTSNPPKPSGRGDMKAGLILLAIGAAIYLARPPSWTPGWDIASYVPGFIGVALLLNALITFLTTRKNSKTPTSTMPSKA